MGLIWAPTLGVVWQRHRELETQLSGPANPGVDFRTNRSITIYISMNNGEDSDAMDKERLHSTGPQNGGATGLRQYGPVAARRTRLALRGRRGPRRTGIVGVSFQFSLYLVAKPPAPRHFRGQNSPSRHVGDLAV